MPEIDRRSFTGLAAGAAASLAVVQYINDVGPQHTFVLPNGVLQAGATNVLALAVLADGTTPAGPGTVALTLLGTAAGGVAIVNV